MQAAVLKKYSKNNLDLEILEVPKPVVKENEVLVKVKTAGVNPVDNLITRGAVKMVVPYKLPLIAGNEFVGVIEELGKNVISYKVGQRVYARLPLNRTGAFAEYIVIKEKDLALVPEYLTDEQAACIPLTALTVTQSLELMDVQEDKTIFISGGTGAVGAMAIPLAKAKGLKVITSGNVINKERVLQAGVDRFFDYKTEDYETVLSDIDYVLDTVGGAETEKQFKILKKGGKLVSLKGMPNGEFAKRIGLPRWKQWLFSLVGKKMDNLAQKNNSEYYFIYVDANGEQLQEVSDIFTRLQVMPTVDTVFEFKDINKALEKVDKGHSKGKTIIKF